MKSLFVVVLALVAITAAVEARRRTRKRGIEEIALGYAQQNNAFPLGGLLDLGALQGIDLKGLTSNLESGLGGNGLTLTARGLHGISSSLGNVGQYGSSLSLSGAGLHDLNLLLQSGKIYGAGLALSNNYAAGGNRLRGGQLPSLPTRAPAPVSIPQASADADDIPPPAPAIGQFGARAPAAPAVSASSGARPAPIQVPAIAFPPNQPIPTPVYPPAPLQVLVYTPSSASSSESSTAVAPAAAPTTAAATAPSLKSAPARTAAPAPAPASTSTSANALVPAAIPAAAPVPAVNMQPTGGRLGSGSLGHISLGNGLFALGSGSLGYTATSPNSQPPAQVQGQQVKSGFADLQTGAQQVGQNAGSQGYPLTSKLPASGQVQNLQLNSGYGGLQGSVAGLYGVQEANYGRQGSGSALQLNQGYASLPASIGGLNGASQLGYVEQRVGAAAGYGGYTLNNDRVNIVQAILNSGLNLGYGGNINSLGYGSGAILSKGY